jgi:hypothetical protein
MISTRSSSFATKYPATVRDHTVRLSRRRACEASECARAITQAQRSGDAIGGIRRLRHCFESQQPGKHELHLLLGGRA